MTEVEDYEAFLNQFCGKKGECSNGDHDLLIFRYNYEYHDADVDGCKVYSASRHFCTDEKGDLNLTKIVRHIVCKDYEKGYFEEAVKVETSVSKVVRLYDVHYKEIGVFSVFIEPRLDITVSNDPKAIENAWKRAVICKVFLRKHGEVFGDLCHYWLVTSNSEDDKKIQEVSEYKLRSRTLIDAAQQIYEVQMRAVDAIELDLIDEKFLMLK